MQATLRDDVFDASAQEFHGDMFVDASGNDDERNGGANLPHDVERRAGVELSEGMVRQYDVGRKAPQALAEGRRRINALGNHLRPGSLDLTHGKLSVGSAVFQQQYTKASSNRNPLHEAFRCLLSLPDEVLARRIDGSRGAKTAIRGNP